MGASNTISGGNKKYFKLTEKKENDKPTGILRFTQQEKVEGTWQPTNEFRAMTGFVKELSIKTYQYQGKDKENLEIRMADNDAPEEIIISLGFSTTVGQNILNTIAGEDSLGLIAFECGEPNIYQGKPYPTLWIKNDGQKTTWKYSKANGNYEVMPKVTKTTDEDGNDIFKGKAAASAFWKEEMNTINEKIKGQDPYPTATTKAKDNFVEELREQDSSEGVLNDDGTFTLPDGTIIDETDSRHPLALPF